MKDVVKSLGETYVMSPIDSNIEHHLKKIKTGIIRALEMGKNSRKNPRFSLQGGCPHCGSRKYFNLHGGQCNRRCADCDEAYNV